MNRRMLLTWVVVVAAIVAGACGRQPFVAFVRRRRRGGAGRGPRQRSGRARRLGSSRGRGRGQKITVQVAGTTITAGVAANGTFELKSIPGGTFTLIFLVDGVEIGRIVVSAEEGSEVEIVVQIKDSVLVVVEIKVEGSGPSPSPSPTSCIVKDSQAGRGWSWRATSARATTRPSR